MHNPYGIKPFTRLRVGLNHLRELTFRHNLQDSLNIFCNCGRYIETIIHFFLHCSNYSNKKNYFWKNSNIKRSLLNPNDSIIVETLLSGSNSLNDEENAWIIESIIEYITITERFITPLLWIHLSKSPLFLKSLIDSESSPYVILFSCLVAQFFYSLFLMPCKRLSSRLRCM